MFAVRGRAQKGRLMDSLAIEDPPAFCTGKMGTRELPSTGEGFRTFVFCRRAPFSLQHTRLREGFSRRCSCRWGIEMRLRDTDADRRWGWGDGDEARMKIKIKIRVKVKININIKMKKDAVSTFCYTFHFRPNTCVRLNSVTCWLNALTV